jgi:mitogen-activated protein kinase 15
MAAAITQGGSRAQLFQTLEEKKPERPAWLEDTDSDSDGEAPPEAALDPRSVPEYPLVEKALLRQYEICSQCGGTGRCVVYKAFERERRRFVALKVVVDAFGDRQSAQRAYREVAYLQVLCGHPNIGRLRGVYCSEVGRHVVLTLDYMHSDLRHAIVSGRLLPIHRTYVLRQLFLALAFMHSARIVHRDIRPSNIVVDDRCRAQVVDLGKRFG